MMTKLKFEIVFLSTLLCVVVLSSSWSADVEDRFRFSPILTQEEEFSGRVSENEHRFALTPETVDNLLKDGSHSLALELTRKALEQGGAPLIADRWLIIQAAAYLTLKQFSSAKNILETLLDRPVSPDPRLVLMLADALMGEMRYEEAQRQYTRFLMLAPKNHPETYRAQRGIAFSALKLGHIEEAALQFELYQKEPNRPHPDLSFLLHRSELAERLGDLNLSRKLLQKISASSMRFFESREALRRVIRHSVTESRLENAVAGWQRLLTVSDLPAGEQREAAHALVSLLGRQGQWVRAVQSLEMLLQKERHGNSRENIVLLLTELHKRWSQRLEQYLVTEEMSSEERRILQRRQMLLDLDRLRRSDQSEELEFLLKKLLDRVTPKLVGLLEEGGLLTPDVLRLTPLSNALKVMYAETYQRLSEDDKALALLEGVETLEADVVRLRTLVDVTGRERVYRGRGNRLGNLGNNEREWSTILERLPKDVNAWTPALIEVMTALLFIQVQHPDYQHDAERTASRLTDVATERQHNPLQRALLFYQAILQNRAERQEQALLIWLTLAYDGTDKTSERDSLLPEDPRLAAARVLEEQGKRREAGVLRRTVSRTVNSE